MRKLLVALICFCSPAVLAEDNIEINVQAACALDPQCPQASFKSISEDLIATVDYKAVVPAEATGVAGFGVGLIVNYTAVDDKQAWKNVTNEDIDALGLVGVGVTKGLPFGIDIGAFYTEIPSTDISLYGAEVRYAILKGGVASPALALRGSYVKVSGIDSFDLDSKSVDLSFSKGFTFITPYVGVGYVFGESDPKGNAGLKKEDVEESKVFAGARISLGLFEFTPEIGQIGDNTLYNLRLGFSFSL